MSIFFDSTPCVAAIRGRPARVRERMMQARSAGTPIAVSSIVLFELWYGVENSGRPEQNAQNLVDFLAVVNAVPFDDADAQVAGRVHGDLRRQGIQIGPYDLLIAAQALRRDCLLITANVREFSRVKGLRWENWEE